MDKTAENERWYQTLSLFGIGTKLARLKLVIEPIDEQWLGCYKTGYRDSTLKYFLVVIDAEKIIWAL